MSAIAPLWSPAWSRNTARMLKTEGAFGTVNWRETLQSWRVLNDPDHAPMRLPAFVCVDGTIQMPNALTPEEYAERYVLFRLASTSKGSPSW